MTDNRPCPSSVMYIKTSSLKFVVWWTVLLVLHAVNAGYFVGAAMLYHYMRFTNVDYQLATYSIGIPPSEYYKVSTIHTLVAVLHMLFMLAMVLGSIQARRLVFHPNLAPWLNPVWAKVRSVMTKATVPNPQVQVEERKSRRKSLTRRLSSISEYSMAVSSSVFARDGLLGVESVYFDHLHLARELLETTLQTIQVYRMSYLLPRVWLIRFYVILLIANCWSTPIVHRYYGHRHADRRMMGLLCDAVLDMVSSIGVSFWIFAAYLPQYTDPAFGFPFDKWFDDVWFTNMQQEFQMMLVVSWADMASRLVFAIGLLQCMQSIKEMLIPVETQENRQSILAEKTASTIVMSDKSKGETMAVKPIKGKDETMVVKPIEGKDETMAVKSIKGKDETMVVKPIEGKDETMAVKPIEGKDETMAVKPIEGKDETPREPDKTIGPIAALADSAKKKKSNISRWNRVVKFILETAGPGFFLVLGLAILVVHIVSETREVSAQIPCQVKLHPWFVSKPACSLVELDCHQLGGLSGSEVSMKEAWNTYEFGATARLFVRHCPQLEMPSTIQQFQQLTSMKVYNSSIVSWPAEAGFISASHQKMRALFFVRTNFSNGELPVGLLTTQFPKQLLNFVTSATNLQKLPEYLHECWPPLMALTFELSLLSTVPPTLFKMNPITLSFSGSRIAMVPRETFENSALQALLLSYTDVQELPRVVQNPSPMLYLLMLDGTNVSTFWSWMDPFVRFSFSINPEFFSAHGSRFCAERDAIVVGNRTSFSITTTEPGAHDLASLMDVSTPEKLRFTQAAVGCNPGFAYYFPLQLQDMTSAIRA